MDFVMQLQISFCSSGQWSLDEKQISIYYDSSLLACMAINI
jgi:hypothetical protein